MSTILAIYALSCAVPFFLFLGALYKDFPHYKAWHWVTSLIAAALLAAIWPGVVVMAVGANLAARQDGRK